MSVVFKKLGKFTFENTKGSKIWHCNYYNLTQKRLINENRDNDNKNEKNSNDSNKINEENQGVLIDAYEDSEGNYQPPWYEYTSVPKKEYIGQNTYHLSKPAPIFFKFEGFLMLGIVSGATVLIWKRFVTRNFRERVFEKLRLQPMEEPQLKINKELFEKP